MRPGHLLANWTSVRLGNNPNRLTTNDNTIYNSVTDTTETQNRESDDAQSTDSEHSSEHAQMYPKTRAKVKEKAQLNYAHFVVLVINLVNGWQKRQSVKIVKSSLCRSFQK